MSFERAKEMNIAKSNSKIGYNTYPCNVGMIVSNEELHISFAISHPSGCNIVNKNTFEMLIHRSVHNTDLKGLPSQRNLDVTLSQLDMILSLNKDKDSFIQSYNTAK